MLSFRLYLAQRLSALVMVPLVIGHIWGMMRAAEGGLTAAEILARTQGSVLWAAFYGLFVVAVAVHGAIGLRVVAAEWLGLRGRGLDALGWGLFLGLLGLGGWAVWAVTGGAP